MRIIVAHKTDVLRSGGLTPKRNSDVVLATIHRLETAFGQVLCLRVHAFSMCRIPKGRWAPLVRMGRDAEPATTVGLIHVWRRASSVDEAGPGTWSPPPHVHVLPLSPACPPRVRRGR